MAPMCNLQVWHGFGRYRYTNSMCSTEHFVLHCRRYSIWNNCSEKRYILYLRNHGSGRCNGLSSGRCNGLSSNFVSSASRLGIVFIGRLLGIRALRWKPKLIAMKDKNNTHVTTRFAFLQSSIVQSLLLNSSKWIPNSNTTKGKSSCFVYASDCNSCMDYIDQLASRACF
jgi:hypothetical protein